MECPELKRELHGQYERFRPSVLLIENKASGTQLILELVVEGLHAVTRYQPQADKVMRMHAQTAMMENGFVHVPDTVSWLAQYLHELTSFPNGRYDDQVEPTAQMLNWRKARRRPQLQCGDMGIAPRAPRRASPRAGAGPACSASAPRAASHRCGCFSGIRRAVTADGTMDMTEADAAPLLRAPAGSGSMPTIVYGRDPNSVGWFLPD
jgi:predicted phage terminase large subunit-like protein